MYRYSPPKSNIWGHALPRMEPLRQKTLFDEFLRQAALEYSFAGGSLTLFAGTPPANAPAEVQAQYGHVTSTDVQRFEQLLRASARDGTFAVLSTQQCELALNEIIKTSALTSGVMLLQRVDIAKWLIANQPVATDSHMMLYFGMKPCVSTFLEFETIEQFEFIRKVLSDLQFCELNKKHLKPVKTATRRAAL